MAQPVGILSKIKISEGNYKKYLKKVASQPLANAILKLWVSEIRIIINPLEQPKIERINTIDEFIVQAGKLLAKMALNC